MILLEKAKKNFEIAEKSAEKEYYDIAVSRLYYSSYQRVVDYINSTPNGEEQLLNYKNNNSVIGGSHDTTISFFQNILRFSNKEQLEIISIIDFLLDMKEARNTADYKEKNICKTKKQYERYKRRTEFINEFIDNLGGKYEQAIEWNKRKNKIFSKI